MVHPPFSVSQCIAYLPSQASVLGRPGVDSCRGIPLMAFILPCSDAGLAVPGCHTHAQARPQPATHPHIILFLGLAVFLG
jgi:hypothetical protein